MAKKKAPSPKDALPRPGDAFLIPLGNGLLGLCRVTAKSKYGRDSRHVALSSWIGDRSPDIEDTHLRDYYVETHHGHGPNRWICVSVSGPAPVTFLKVGTIVPLEFEAGLYPAVGTTWATLSRELLTQWRWDNDREALLQDEQVEKEVRERQREELAVRKQEARERLTLLTLKTKRRFPEWEGDRPAAAITETRKVFGQLIESLIAIGPELTQASVSEHVRRSVEALNALDETYDGFIETGEREALCAELDEIVNAAGLRGCEGLADEWRDW